MRRYVLICLSGLLFANIITAQENEQKDQCRAIYKYQYGDDRSHLAKIEERVKSTSPADYGSLEEGFIELLKSPDSSIPARHFACRQLSVVGGAKSVPVLAGFLKDPEMSHMARYAMQGMECPSVDEELLKALDCVDGKIRIGIISSISARRDANAVKPLAGLIKADRETAQAALLALGSIGGKPAEKAISKAKVGEDLQAVKVDALLKVAGSYLKDGDKKAAASIYREFLSPENSRYVRVAALRGLALADGVKAADDVVKAMASEDDMLALAAGRIVVESGLSGEFASRLQDLSSRRKVILIDALADICDKSVSGAVAGLIKSDDEAVKKSAMAALGVLGGVADLDLLLKSVEAQDNMSEAALNAINAMPSESVSEDLLKRLSSASDKVRDPIIGSLAARRYHKAIPDLVKLAKEGQEQTRISAIKALGQLGSEAELPVILEIVISSSGAVQKEAEQAVFGLVSGSGDTEKRLAPIVAAFSKGNADARVIMLKSLARLGGKAGLETVCSAVKDADGKVSDAAIRALADWPDVSASDELMKIVNSAEQQVHKVLAFRGYIRLADKEGNEGKRLEMLKGAMGVAPRPDEKRLVLGSLKNIRHINSLKYAATLMDDAETVEEASSAVMEIAKSIIGKAGAEDKSAIESALKKVVEVSKNEGLINEAKKHLPKQ